MPLGVSSVQRVRSDLRSNALAQADVVAVSANGLIKPPQLPDLGELVRTTAFNVKGRVIVVDSKGILLADSSDANLIGADYSTRPEIKLALAGKSSQVQRTSKSLNRELLATAVPVVSFGQTIGAVRITQSPEALNDSIRRSIYVIAAVGLLVLVLGLGAGWVIAHQLSGPMRRLEGVAVDVAGGDLDARAAVEGPTEQQNLAIAFNDMTDQLIRLVESQRQFVADASHQLRTPLAALRLRVEEAKELGVSPDAGEELDAGLKELARIRRIIDDLLMLSKIGERRGPAERIAIADFVDRAADRWTPIAAESGIRVRVERVSDPSRPTCVCDPSDLDRVVDALLENSVRYCPPDTEIVIVAGDASVSVLDQGPGIGADEGEAIFERFRRGTAGQAVAHGTGLGLAIARDLIRVWGGDVTIRNREEGGAAATISLSDTTLPVATTDANLE
ncbi:MAG: ATP-binding protein [Actinomycetes bacterium]